MFYWLTYTTCSSNVCLLCVHLWEDSTNCQWPPRYHCYEGYVISLALTPYECLDILNVGRFALEATTDGVLLSTTSRHLTSPRFHSGAHLVPLSTPHKLICTFRFPQPCSPPVIFCIGRLLWGFCTCHFFLLKPVTKKWRTHCSSILSDVHSLVRYWPWPVVYSMQFVTVTRLSPCIEASSWRTNGHWYVSEASKNPVFIGKKNVNFSVVPAETLQPFKTTCLFAKRNVTTNYYYLAHPFLWIK